MRKDMFKVIVERPRRNGGRSSGKHASGRRVRDADLPAVAPMRLRGSKTKWLNENLAPLERFLDKRVGRYWPKVFSELCEHISVDNAVQRHVRDHIDDFVTTKTMRREDGIWATGRGAPFPLRECYWVKFYVHPVSQVLMRNKYWHRFRKDQRAREAAKAAEVAKRFRRVGPYRGLHKLDGIWYELRLSPLPPGRDDKLWGWWSLYDGSALATVTREALAERAPGYAIAKRQLSTRELVEAKLANDPAE